MMQETGQMVWSIGLGHWTFGLLVWTIVILCSVYLIKYLIRTRQ